MTTTDIGRHSSVTRAGLFDRLVVHSDLANRSGPPLMPVGAMASIVALVYPAAIVMRSLPVAIAIIAALVIFMVWLIAGFVRAIYCARNPYVSSRWLAAARATLGDKIINSALEQLRAQRALDDVLGRRELVHAIAAQRQAPDRVHKVAAGVRLRDVLEDG